MLKGKGPLFDARTKEYKALWDAIEEYANCPSRCDTMIEEVDLAIKIFARAVEKCAIEQGRREAWAGV